MKSDAIEELYPLSPAQQGMLFHSLYAPESGVYVFQVITTLEGDVDLAAFLKAWQEILDRHAILRTAFVWENLDSPLQVVCRRATLPVTEHDWRGVSNREQHERMQNFLSADRRQGFDLAKAPLMRLAAIRLGEQRYRFCWTSHHLLLDGWSTSQVFSEIFACYQALRRHQKPQLARVRPYRDYIAWLLQQDLSAAESFWRQTLAGFSAPTPLGVDRPAADLLDANDYGEDQLTLSGELSAALQQIGRQQQLTLNTMVQGAWALLLSRYSGERDVVFGATVSGRPGELPGVEAMVGPFINTLPVRVKVPREQPVAAWLRDLQQQQVEMRQYEYSPLVDVQGWSDVPRGVPLFESLLVFENYPRAGLSTAQQRSAGAKNADVQSVEMTNYPLTVVVAPGEQVSLQMMYDRRRLE